MTDPILAWGIRSGLDVRESVHAVEYRWTRRPRSKRKRIRKKWRSKRRNWTAYPMAYLLEGGWSFGILPPTQPVIIAHPVLVAQIWNRS